MDMSLQNNGKSNTASLTLFHFALCIIDEAIAKWPKLVLVRFLVLKVLGDFLYFQKRPLL